MHTGLPEPNAYINTKFMCICNSNLTQTETFHKIKKGFKVSRVYNMKTFQTFMKRKPYFVKNNAVAEWKNKFSINDLSRQIFNLL